MKRSKKRLALLLAAMMAFSLVPVVAGAEGEDPSVTISLPADGFVIGQAQEFSVSTKAGSLAGTNTMVKGIGTFPLDADSVFVEYKEVQDGKWYELKGDSFGPPSGFPMMDATSEFRATFKKAGTYTLKVDIVKADDPSQVIATDTKTVVISEAGVKIDLPKDGFVVGQTQEFSISTVPGSYTGTMVKGTAVFPVSSDDVLIEYKEIKDGNWYELKGDSFGPKDGFPMMAATSEFRATFKKAGSYPLEVKIVKVDDGEVIASAKAKIEVAAAPVSVATIKLPEGGFTVNEKGEFTVSIKANSAAGEQVVEALAFGFGDKLLNDKVASLEVFVDGAWKEVELVEQDGESLFLLSHVPVTYADKEIKVRVAFKEAGDYEIVYVAGSETDIVAMTYGQFTVKTAGTAVEPTPTPSNPDIPKTGEADHTWVLLMGLVLLAGGAVVLGMRKHA